MPVTPAFTESSFLQIARRMEATATAIYQRDRLPHKPGKGEPSLGTLHTGSMAFIGKITDGHGLLRAGRE